MIRIFIYDLGRISVSDWCNVVSRVLDLNLPWRTLKSRLVDTDSNGWILYESAFRFRGWQFPLNVPISQVKVLVKRNEKDLFLM